MGWIGKSPDRDKEEDGMTQAIKKLSYRSGVTSFRLIGFISICSTKEGFEGKRLNFSYISFTKLVYFRAIMLNCSHVAYAGVSISTTCLTNRRKLNEKCGSYLSAIMQKLW